MRIYVSRSNEVPDDEFALVLDYLRTVFPDNVFGYYDKSEEYGEEYTHMIKTAQGFIYYNHGKGYSGKGCFDEYNGFLSNSSYYKSNRSMLYRKKSDGKFQFYDFRMRITDPNNYKNHAEVVFGEKESSWFISQLEGNIDSHMEYNDNIHTRIAKLKVIENNGSWIVVKAPSKNTPTLFKLAKKECSDDDWFGVIALTIPSG